MELLCINADIIKGSVFKHLGSGLIEGEVYTTKYLPFKGKGGRDNYLIEGLGPKLVERFIPLEREPIFKKEEILENVN